jgi:hypothetical protein
VTAFRLMAPALQAPWRNREVEMEAGVHATSASTVEPVLAVVPARVIDS